jgi:DNA-binding SARP family transcriptional activator
MIRLCAVGQCAIELDGVRVTAESEIVFGLLLYLAARAGEQVPRDDVLAMFWPEMPHTRGRHCLRQTAYRLRQLGVPLRADNGSLGVGAEDVTSDFASLVADDATARTYVGVSLGEVLPSYAPVFSAPFATWVEDYRSRTSMRIRQAIVRVLVDLRSKGRYREAEPLARACLTSDPFNEVATLTLAEATAVLSGNRAEALMILDRYMDEVEVSADRRLTWSATVLRRRISERFVEQRYSAPPEPPFVGREDVLQLLVEKMQEAVTGRSSVVYLWGEPGIGKTRLLDELVKVAKVQGVHVERYNVSPNDAERPLAVFSTLLPRLLQMQGAVGISPSSYRSLERFIEPKAWEQAESPRTTEEAARTFRRLKNGICELFDVLAEERALCFCIDDAHWLDNRSIEVLADIADRVRQRPVLLALTSRTGPFGVTNAALKALCAVAAVRRVDGLAPAEIERLLERMADQRSFAWSSEFVRRTVDVSAGNPLFVSELANHFFWTGHSSELPLNLQTLLAKRLDSISESGLVLFQTVAALGQHATIDHLRSVLQIPTHKLIQAVTETERLSLLTGAPDRIECRHDLLAVAALDRLTPLARAALWRKTASVLESAALEELSSAVCWAAAQKWMEAGEAARALKVVTTTARRLLASGLVQDADLLLGRARTMMQDEYSATRIIPLQWRAARAVGDLNRLRALALECQAVARASRGGDEASFAEFAEFDAARLLDCAPKDSPVDAVRLEQSTEPPDVLLELATRLLIRADDILDPILARRCYVALRNRHILEQAAGNRRLIFEMMYHSHFGNLATGVARARRILSAGRRVDGPGLEIQVRECRWAHRPILLSGLFEEALAALELSVQAARRYGSVFDEIVSLCYRVDSLVAADRLEEAQETFDVIDSRPIDTIPEFVRRSSLIMRAFTFAGRLQVPDLTSALDTVERHVKLFPNNRQQVSVDSLRIFEDLLQGRDASGERLLRLARCWQAARTMSSADAPLLAMSAAHLVKGDATTVAQLCDGYAEARREQFPLSGALRRPFLAVLEARGISAPDAIWRCFGPSTARPLD